MLLLQLLLATPEVLTCLILQQSFFLVNTREANEYMDFAHVSWPFVAFLSLLDQKTIDAREKLADELKIDALDVVRAKGIRWRGFRRHGVLFRRLTAVIINSQRLVVRLYDLPLHVAR